MTWGQLVKSLNSFPTYVIELGVQVDKKKRYDIVEVQKVSKKTGKTYIAKQKVGESGVNNAEILYVNEFGSPARHIPPRPVLHITIDHVIKNWLPTERAKLVRLYIDGGFKTKLVEEELDKFCIRVQNYCRRIIYKNDGTLKENAPYTIAMKGDNHPLFDTGQLARSITCKYYRLN